MNKSVFEEGFSRRDGDGDGFGSVDGVPGGPPLCCFVISPWGLLNGLEG